MNTEVPMPKRPFQYLFQAVEDRGKGRPVVMMTLFFDANGRVIESTFDGMAGAPADQVASCIIKAGLKVQPCQEREA